jgi:hypothetical protein
MVMNVETAAETAQRAGTYHPPSAFCHTMGCWVYIENKADSDMFHILWLVFETS